jgi:hypothetical protein
MPIGLSGEGIRAIDLGMVLICADDLQTRRAGGFFVFRLALRRCAGPCSAWRRKTE